MTKYLFQVCDREWIQCYPLAVDVLGGWHSDAADVESKLGRQCNLRRKLIKL